MSDNRHRNGRSFVASLLIAFLLAGAPPAALTQQSDAAPQPAVALAPIPEAVRTVAAQPDVRRIVAGGMRAPGSFEVALDTAPDTIARAFLVYELAGVPHWTAAVRSINGLPALGGFGAAATDGTVLQVEEINPRWLRAGANEIRFYPVAEGNAGTPAHVTDLRRHDGLAWAEPDFSIPYTVRNLRLIYADGPGAPLPALHLTYPAGGESSDDGTVVRGYVDPPMLAGGAAELFVDDAYIPQGIDRTDGSFAVYAPRTGPAGEAWDVTVDVVYPDGTHLRQSAKVGGDSHKDDGDSDDSTHLDADGTTEKSMSLGGAHLDVTRDALATKVKLTMRRLRHDELPALDAGMTNVTPERRGFRFGPHGLRFRKAVRLHLPYDAALLPKGMTSDDVRTFFFDESSGRWVPIARVGVAADMVVSATEHFTDFINATLAVPDHPEGTNFSPNSLEELAKADPASQIVQIAPPEGGATGDASLDFPIIVPAGRHGMQPELSVHYDSGGGDGWLGVGWDLSISSIEIDTEFGVPRYDAAHTTTYRLDGELLAPSQSEAGVYVRRSEGKFDRIERSGDGWLVTDKNGTKHQYGVTAQARLSNPHNAAQTFRWYLEHDVDLRGNTVDYSYATDTSELAPVKPGHLPGEPWMEVYPKQIDYTGGNGAAPYFSVVFKLDGGHRADTISSGRQGFKTYRRYRLDSVDVNAGGALVRRYALSYAEGEFAKSVLSSIAVTGEDGATTLYRHDFEYTKMPRRDDGTIDGFTEQQSWGGMAAASNFTSSSQVGGGAHGFVGLGPTDCQPHGGVQLGGGGSATTESVAFADVDGDGLPDRIDSSGHVDLNLYKPANDASGVAAGSFGSWQMAGAQTIGHTSEWNIDFGGGLHLETGVTAIAGATWSWSHSNEDHLLLDVNGDRRPDLVSTDGGFSVLLNDGSKFAAVPWSGFDAAGLHLSSAKEESDSNASFTLTNTLLQLVLPYPGNVTMSGAIQKKEAGGDGVDASIYLNWIPIWTHHFAAGDTAPCAPGPANGCGGGLTATVNTGDSLYFLTGSGRETSKDAVLWTPVVTYNGQDAAVREPFGPKVFVFDAGRDFSFYGYRGAGWSAIAAGDVAVSGTLVKQETSDDVTVNVVRHRPVSGQLGIEETIFSRTFTAAEQTSVSIAATTSVVKDDSLFFRVTSALPIDGNAIKWTPTVSYVGATTPPSLPSDVLTQPAQVAAAPPKLITSSLATAWWKPTTSGDHTLAFVCTIATPATLYVQGVNRLLTKQNVAAGPSAFGLHVTAAAGDQVFVTLLGATSSSPGNCTAAEATGTVQLPVPVPVNVVWHSNLDFTNVLSGGYHGWYYGEWNGSVPFNPAELVQPKSKDDSPPNWVAALPRWNGTKDYASPAWIASGFDLYLAADGVKPSRKGMNVAATLDLASGITAGGGLSTLRKSSTNTVGASASVGVGTVSGGLTYSHGQTDTQLDLIDMNGDGYPDQVSADGVRFSNGSSFGPLQSFANFGSAVRHSEDDNAGVSAGFGVNFTKKNGKGEPTAVLNVMPSAGNDVSVTQTFDDLIDVNGDGLPDRVHMNPGLKTNQVTVQLNLGYGFGAAETWDLPPLKAAGHCTDTVSYVSDGVASALSPLDTMNGLSFTVSSEVSAEVAVGPFGGGASTSLSRTLVELVDINGDGLPDRVAKDSQDDFFRVQLNLGDHWDDEHLWYAPRWRSGSQPGDGYNVLSPSPFQFQCLDAVSLTGNIQGQGSAGVPLCIPLIVVGIQVEISGQVYGSNGNGMQLFLEDIDGDGVPDHILKIANDATVYVKRNRAAKVNLLSAIHRPLGSTINLSYERRGNTTSMPMNQWVLSAVSVSDPRTPAPYVTTYKYDNDAVYDRAERESYGFHHLLVTLPDGSTIDRHFKNDDLYGRHLLADETFSGTGGGYTKTLSYAEDSVADRAKFPKLTSETTVFSEPGGTMTSVDAYTYDTAGNVLSIVDRGEDVADGATADDVVTTIEYQIDSVQRFTHPKRVTVQDRTTLATYNSNGELTQLVKVLKGGKDASGAAYDGSRNPAWNIGYDAYGNVASYEDATHHKYQFTYDDQTHSDVIEVDDATFGYVTKNEYNPKYGALTKTTDENGNVMLRAYDQFGRISQLRGPDDLSANTPTIRFTYGFGAPAAWAVVEQKDVTRGDATIASSVFIDSLERVIQTKEAAELDGASAPGMRVSGPIAFDRKGRVASEGQPLFDPNTDPKAFVESTAARNATTLAYDALDRVTKVTFPYQHAGTTTNCPSGSAATTSAYGIASYGGRNRFVTRRTDPECRTTTFYRDLHQNVVAIQQANGLTTNYQYDLLDELTTVTDPNGNATKVTYDSFGRTVTIDNPDLGSVETRYDVGGNLAAKINANLAALNQKILYSYTADRLDRVDYPKSPAVVYTYGSAQGAPSNGANRLISIADGSGVEQLSYDKLGNVVKQVKTAAALNGATPKGPYTTTYAYDAFGRLLALGYPDGDTLTYGFDAGGNVKSVSGSLRGTPYTYVRLAGYDEFGERVHLVLGNGAESRYTYDPASRFLKGLRTTAAGRDLQSLAYKYDASGTMTSLQNAVAVPAPALYGGPTSQTFSYDSIVQLTQASGTYTTAPNAMSTYTLGLTYDNIGNLTAKNQLHQTGPGGKLTEKKTTYNVAYSYNTTGARPHAPTRIGDRTFHYDANGNQTGWETDGNGTVRTLTWDEENRLKSVSDNGKTTSFLYDAGGTRTNKAGQNGETIYLNPWYSLRNGNIASKHVFLDGERLATKVTPDPVAPSEKIYFYHPDHLGSANFVTDETGLAYEHLEYFPTGEIWVDEHSDTQRTPSLFSGKELDDETGLSYFGARYYDAREGQWISADPILDGMLEVEKLGSTEDEPLPFFLPGQTYAYVTNDPVNLTDPDGLVPSLAQRRASKRPKRSVQRSPTTEEDEIGAEFRKWSYPIGGSNEALAGGTGNYDVGAKVFKDNKEFSAQYDANTNVHAEIGAIEKSIPRNVKRTATVLAHLAKINKIRVTKPCCRRCAVVIRILRLDQKVGPKRSGKTSATAGGAYDLPPRIRAAVIAQWQHTHTHSGENVVNVIKTKKWW